MMVGFILAAFMTVGAAEELGKSSSTFYDECRYIMTTLETKMWKSLDTDEERQTFITNFWKGVDPNPLTEVNEFRDLYYRRIEEANQKFTRGKPGYLTDRGKIYVLLGPPDETMRYAMGNKADDKPSETWTYRSAKHKGMVRDASFKFVDETGTGNFYLDTQSTEVDAGMARNTAKVDLQAMQSMLDAQENPRDDMTTTLAENMAAAQAPPTTTAEAPPAAALSIDSVTRYDFFKALEGKTLVAMTVGIPKAKAGAGKDGYKVFAKVQPKDPSGGGSTEDMVDLFKAEEGKNEILFQAQVPLLPAVYRVIYGITETASGATKSVEDALTVPGFDDSKLQLSSVVAAGTIDQSTASSDPLASTAITPFRLSGSHVVPLVETTFGKSDELKVYFQIYGAAPDPATQKPHLDINYMITRKASDGTFKGVGRMPAENQSELVQVYELPLADISRGLKAGTDPAGEYKLEVTVTDKVSNKVARGTQAFKIK